MNHSGTQRAINESAGQARLKQNSDAGPLNFFRVRWTLRPKEIATVPPQHSAMIYAMICDATAAENGGQAAMPEGVLLAAPDQGLVEVDPQVGLSLACTFLDSSPKTAARRIQQLHVGLVKLGRNPARGQRLKQFDVVGAYDLVAQRMLQGGQAPTALSVDKLDDQLTRLVGQESIVLRFDSPLRCSRPKIDQREGHVCFDQQFFSARLFLNRLSNRLASLGWEFPAEHDDGRVPSASPVDLVWLDVGYGGKHAKTLGGVVGRVEFRGLSTRELMQLILGQFVHVGENTRFGFGRYQIEDSQLTPAAIQRSQSLVDYALSSTAIDSVATEYGLESGILRRSADEIDQGTYRCDPHYTVEIPKDGGSRTLRIPSLRDRALQRLILQRIAPAIDGFLESSAIANRRGLGREQAPRRIRQAARDGFRWSVKADFLGFFDSVQHSVLFERLRAYLPDSKLIDLLTHWVTEGAPARGVGLATGSPLSPVLANLLLDQFDERITRHGVRLVRYADDFLILCRDKQQAESLASIARDEASALALQLNENKTLIASPGEAFQFVGYRFEFSELWRHDEIEGAVAIEDLGWRKAQQRTVPKSVRFELPGEGTAWNSGATQTLILGPGMRRLEFESDHAAIDCEGKPRRKIPLNGVTSVLVIDRTEVPWHSQCRMASSGIAVEFCDLWGQPEYVLAAQPRSADARWVQLQLQIASDVTARLTIARRLVQAKIHNYACLADTVAGSGSRTARELWRAALAAGSASSIDFLLGIEGNAAAVWYAEFPRCLGRDFTFTHRVAPDAADPVNVLLNIGHTIVHRLATRLIAHSGLLSTIGILHSPRAGHHSLASDLQEPLRHVVDRAVIEATGILRATDFRVDSDGQYPLTIQPRARIAFLELLHQHLATGVHGHRQSEPIEYRRQIDRMLRSLKEAMEKSVESFEAFRHPSPRLIKSEPMALAAGVEGVAR